MLKMEKRIAVKIEEHIDEFKTNIKLFLEKNNNIDFSAKSELLKYIYDYQNLTLTKEDFVKRKRSKSIVPVYLKCQARRATGEQCTRKHKEDSKFCGTHDKNRPHGIIDSDNSVENNLKKKEVFVQEFNGINYYIDHANNIYSSDDILSNKTDPNIIGKYTIIDGIYKIHK